MQLADILNIQIGGPSLGWLTDSSGAGALLSQPCRLASRLCVSELGRSQKPKSVLDPRWAVVLYLGFVLRERDPSTIPTWGCRHQPDGCASVRRRNRLSIRAGRGATSGFTCSSQLAPIEVCSNLGSLFPVGSGEASLSLSFLYSIR